MKPGRKIIIVLAVFFLLLNAVAAYHAYRFTHFERSISKKQHKPENLVFFSKVWVLLKGIDNPRTQNTQLPEQKFNEIMLNGHSGKISCWFVPKENAKGIVILFHGYGGSKSNLLMPARTFDSMGYQTMMVDFEGSGNSEGNRTTIGYYEAEDVKAAFDYCKKIDSNIVLFGSSLGASAIMRAVSVYKLNPNKLILECPYGSMFYAAKNRFKIMGIPSFPMAYLLVFWGGVENGFNAYSQDCIKYAEDIKMQVLLMRGMNDKYVSEKETNEIFNNLNGLKTLHLFANTGHESYCLKDHFEWINQINLFLELK